ncbi:MAG: lytic transglycosylase domain-containing protein, partial [Desulfovibrio sp.]|nr:lytic transglycosylase domain-containing protein [Desulfovibrio sp.]
NFNHLAVSPKGAQGAMQIMPATQVQLGLTEPFDLRRNILAGSAFMHKLLVKYGSVELALAAYNAGPGAVDKYHGIPPYRETQNYVQRVLNIWKNTEQIGPSLALAQPKKTNLKAKAGKVKDNPKPQVVKEKLSSVITTSVITKS